MTVLDKLKQVPAEKLSGPRVYSTDLMPSLLDAQDPVASLDFAARALKIKLITKSQVTLNAAHLVGPLGLMTFKSDPGLIGNGQIIPAIRSGTGSLSDLIREAMEAKKARDAAWKEENRAAIESWNEYIHKNGMPYDKYRQF